MKSIRHLMFPVVIIIGLILGYSIVALTINNDATTTTAYAQTPVPTPSPSPNIVPAVAKIKGPSTVLVGTLLFLSADEATGDNFKWLIPEELTQTSAICNTSIFFAIPTPGEYSFGLVAVNKAAEIDVAYHKVKVTTHPGNGPPVVDPPKDPPKSFDELIKVSKEAVTKLSDPTTASALKSAISKIVAESGIKTLDELRKETIVATTTVFMNRKGDSQKKEWGQLWVEPIDTSIFKLNIKDPLTYVELLKALATTL